MPAPTPTATDAVLLVAAMLAVSPSMRVLSASRRMVDAVEPAAMSRR